MADKTIGELENSQITSADDKLIFENSSGETKNVKYKDLFARNNLTSPFADIGFIMKDYQTGDVGNYSFPGMMAQIFMTTVVAGTGISITGQSTAEGFIPTISCTVSGGSTWYFGSTAPANAQSGDFWLRTDSGHYGDVDEYDGSAWTNAGTFAGRDGADGQAATVTVGTVTTGAAGTNASVTNSGTSSAAVLDFVIPRGADGQGGSSITVSGTLTLTSAGWSNGAQTVSFAHDTSKRNVIDITPSEIPKWAQYGVYAVSETSTGITFNCVSTPNEALTFKVTSMEVTA